MEDGLYNIHSPFHGLDARLLHEAGINEVLKHAWIIATKKEDLIDEKIRLQALSLAIECYRHKMDLITNGVVIDDALKFVNEHKDNIKLNGIDTEFETTNKAVF